MIGRYELLGVVNSGVKNFRRIRPAAIQISSYHVASIVADDDTIWIQHRYNLEYEILPQKLCFLVLRMRQEIQHTSHHV